MPALIRSVAICALIPSDASSTHCGDGRRFDRTSRSETELVFCSATPEGLGALGSVVPNQSSMSWRPVDCHAHSTFSDGELAPAAVAARAAVLGIRGSIADHISRDVARSITDVAQVRGY